MATFVSSVDVEARIFSAKKRRVGVFDANVADSASQIRIIRCKREVLVAHLASPSRALNNAAPYVSQGSEGRTFALMTFLEQLGLENIRTARA